MGEHLDLLNETEHAHDVRPSIGFILCSEKDDIEVKPSGARQPAVRLRRRRERPGAGAKQFALKTKQNTIGCVTAFDRALEIAFQLLWGFSSVIKDMLPHEGKVCGILSKFHFNTI